ncbi:MAG TPA: extracellular solute-binding protein [Pseudolabrys sp.]|jgi:microcin C transport system substrate-binding protein
MNFSRRSVLRAAASAFASTALSAFGVVWPRNAALAQAQKWRHALSLFGDTKYPEGFKHFEYVNPNAPQGGTVRQVAFGTFDNFNTVVSGVKGNIAAGTELFIEPLMTPALDEVSTEYGLLAEAVSFPEDFSAVTYRLRAGTRWHDGKPIIPEDVLFSFDALKKNSPFFGAYYRHVQKAEKTGEREISFTFDGPGNRELPQIVGQLPVLPKHWWEGTDKSGNKRDITQTTLEPPLGSGPYRLKEFIPGRTLVYEKVGDYWGRDLNVIVGTRNFQTIRFEYYRDSIVALEAFKADQADWRVENSAKDWATAYDFPAVRDKRVVLEEFPIRNIGVMQAFAFNIRRDKFKDTRVRRAFNFAFDFEEMNRQIFFGQYRRIASYFEGTELASSGIPEGLELEILQAVKDKVPAELFTKPYTNPVGGNPQNVRNNTREALTLLRSAGYEIRNTKLVNAASGEPFQVELLVEQPAFERIMLFYKPSLERLGIAVSVRTIDPSQYENRLRQWDFDIIINSWAQSLSPGNEQRGFWGSQAADQPGSRNLIGIKNPAVDALIDRVIFAKSRAELVAATKALDRVLLWNNYVVPQWTYGKQRTARWDRFGHPDNMPRYGASAFPTVWWWDAARAAKVPQRS